MDLLSILEQVKDGSLSPLVARIQIQTLNIKAVHKSITEMKTSDWDELSRLVSDKVGNL